MKNSRRSKSSIFSLKYIEKAPPNEIRLNKYMEYAAENTMDEQAKAPAKGSRSNAP